NTCRGLSGGIRLDMPGYYSSVPATRPPGQPLTHDYSSCADAGSEVAGAAGRGEHACCSLAQGDPMSVGRKTLQGYRYPSLDLYIDGEFRAATGADSSQVIDPATEEPLGVLHHASVDDVQQALDAAARAFMPWREQPALERGRRLRRVAERIRAGGESLAMTITLELGKPWAESLVEVQTAAEMFEWAAEEAVRSYGRVIPPREAGGFQYARLEPIGPVAAFSGWNAPAITPSRKIAGALAAG